MSDTLRTDRALLFEQFIDLYYPSIFSAITKLSGLSDEKDLEILTVKIFVDLWQNSDELFAVTRPPALIYKTLLYHVMEYLKKKGNDTQLEQLKNTVLIK